MAAHGLGGLFYLKLNVTSFRVSFFHTFVTNKLEFDSCLSFLAYNCIL